ncbi:hypothetical protein SLS58_006415 [Diplodia intermedia]|uniref:Uncharacterized protein n=1 Tax=Diplodia intermedia TaxID=856260 RepID=A0ABR3TN05_9PEZI
MTPPKARPVGRKASFTAFALQAQSNLLSPGLASDSTSDQEVALSPSPSKRKAGIHDHDDEPQPRKQPSLDLNTTNAPMDIERHEPGEVAPQHSAYNQPTLKLRLPKDTSVSP